MEEELKELLKKYIKHSLCTTPKGIQSRVYLDSEEISNLKTEFPQTKPLSDEEILKFIHEKFVMFGFEADYIVDDNELIEFARAIEERHGIHVQKT